MATTKLEVLAAVLWLLAPAWTSESRAATAEEIGQLVDQGRWNLAREAIKKETARPDLRFEERTGLLFQQERMARIGLDFNRTRPEVLRRARAIVPGLAEDVLQQWERDGALESLDIDGERRFFHGAADNLFRIHPEAKALKTRQAPGASLALPYRLDDIRAVMARRDRAGERLSYSKRWRVTYSLAVHPGIVPPGEIIRAWLPLPQEGGRQTDVRVIAAEPARYIQSPPSARLSSVYMEKPSPEGARTTFKLVFEYTASGFYCPIDPDEVRPGPPSEPALAPFLAQEPPHLVFSPQLSALAAEIAAGETNAFRKARRFFRWVAENIPWGVAREYSTVRSLPEYALANRHGDCGVKTMLLMNLCRLGGIPARWESGWITGPEKNMHDWCEIYLEPYGWLPVDVSYGLVASDDERERWFFLGGTDACRLVVNTDHSQPLYPAKTFFRSEPIDFQRGEVEWRGGNLYFDQWDWDFRVEEISPKPQKDAKNAAGSK